MSEVEAKQKIAELVEKYEQIKKSGGIKKYRGKLGISQDKLSKPADVT